MTPKQAENIASRLIQAGIMTEAHAENRGGSPSSPFSPRHPGGKVVYGRYAERPGRPARNASIICPDVAEAMLKAGRWTMDAWLNGCQHPQLLRGQKPAPERRRITPAACPCPAHHGRRCESTQRIALAEAAG